MTKTYIDNIADVAAADLAAIREKDKNYGGSWKRRGGVGAFMMLARKWDRLEQQVQAQGYDVFKAAQADKRDEGVIDDIRDLRRYLTLVEAELMCAEASADVEIENVTCPICGAAMAAITFQGKPGFGCARCEKFVAPENAKQS